MEKEADWERKAVGSAVLEADVYSLKAISTRRVGSKKDYLGLKVDDTTLEAEKWK